MSPMLKWLLIPKISPHLWTIISKQNIEWVHLKCCAIMREKFV